jgi:hypothetical protein
MTPVPVRAAVCARVAEGRKLEGNGSAPIGPGLSVADLESPVAEPMWSDYAMALPWRVTGTRPPSPPEGLSKAPADPAQDKSAGHTTADRTPPGRDGNIPFNLWALCTY